MLTVGHEMHNFVKTPAFTADREPNEVEQATKAAAQFTVAAKVQSGIHRFWRLREVEVNKSDDVEVDDESNEEQEAELWILRFATTQQGHMLSSAFRLLDSYDVVDRALRGKIRADRAPKGNLQKQIEGLLSAEGGGRTKK